MQFFTCYDVLSERFNLHGTARRRWQALPSASTKCVVVLFPNARKISIPSNFKQQPIKNESATDRLPVKLWKFLPKNILVKLCWRIWFTILWLWTGQGHFLTPFIKRKTSKDVLNYSNTVLVSHANTTFLNCTGKRIAKLRCRWTTKLAISRVAENKPKSVIY